MFLPICDVKWKRCHALSIQWNMHLKFFWEWVWTYHRFLKTAFTSTVPRRYPRQTRSRCYKKIPQDTGRTSISLPKIMSCICSCIKECKRREVTLYLVMSTALAFHCLIFCHVYLAVFVPRLYRISWESEGVGWISNWSSEERGDLWVSWMCWRDKMETRIRFSVCLEFFYYVWQGSKYTALSSNSTLRFIHELQDITLKRLVLCRYRSQISWSALYCQRN